MSIFTRVKAQADRQSNRSHKELYWKMIKMFTSDKEMETV